MTLHDDFREFLRLLISHRVRFVVVGAHALAAHGSPRYTGDLDVFVEPTAANARRLLAALHDFGFGALGLVERDFTRANRVAQLGYPPVRIDVLTGISGVGFGEAWRGRRRARLAGLQVPLLGVDEFIKNKRAAARPKDLADIALIQEALAARSRSARRVEQRPARPVSPGGSRTRTRRRDR